MSSVDVAATADAAEIQRAIAEGEAMAAKLRADADSIERTTSWLRRTLAGEEVPLAEMADPLAGVRCSCGQPAVRMISTEKFGTVPSCRSY